MCCEIVILVKQASYWDDGHKPKITQQNFKYEECKIKLLLKWSNV